MKSGPEVVQTSGTQARLCHVYVSGYREANCHQNNGFSTGLLTGKSRHADDHKRCVIA